MQGFIKGWACLVMAHVFSYSCSVVTQLHPDAKEIVTGWKPYSSYNFITIKADRGFGWQLTASVTGLFSSY